MKLAELRERARLGTLHPEGARTPWATGFLLHPGHPGSLAHAEPHAFVRSNMKNGGWPDDTVTDYFESFQRVEMSKDCVVLGYAYFAQHPRTGTLHFLIPDNPDVEITLGSVDAG